MTKREAEGFIQTRTAGEHVCIRYRRRPNGQIEFRRSAVVRSGAWMVARVIALAALIGVRAVQAETPSDTNMPTEKSAPENSDPRVKMGEMTIATPPPPATHSSGETVGRVAMPHTPAPTPEPKE